MMPLGHPRFDDFILQGYPEYGGLYRDGELVYTFDRWTEIDALYFSDGGMSFLRVPASMGQLRFYTQGVMVRYGRVRDLLRDSQSIQRGWDSQWDPGYFGESSWRIEEATYHDRANNRLKITSVEGYEITFDLSTGFVLSQYRLAGHSLPEQSAQSERNILMAMPLGIILLIVVGVVIFLHAKKVHRVYP